MRERSSFFRVGTGRHGETEWLIFGARGRKRFFSFSREKGRAKECLAFDLCAVPEVADAQTSSGTSRIVLAPFRARALLLRILCSALHARFPSHSRRYKTDVGAFCSSNLCESFIPPVVSRHPSTASSPSRARRKMNVIVRGPRRVRVATRKTRTF